MIPYLIFAVIIAAIASAGVVYSNSRKRAAREKFEAQFPPDAIELDPIADAPLMGEHYWMRIELFDLLQKGYVRLEDDQIKCTGKAQGENLSEVQQLMLIALQPAEDEDGMVGGELLGEIATNPLVAEKCRVFKEWLGLPR